MTETTTLSVEGDRLEEIARVIAATIYGITSDSEWSALFGYAKTNCLETARQIAALPCKGGWALREALEKIEAITIPGSKARSDRPKRAMDAIWIICREAFRATRTTEPDTGRGLREALEALAEHTNWELSHDYPDEEAEGEWQVHRVTGNRSDREWTLIGRGETPATALAQALAALSDTPREREEEGKQGLMASRDLRPTTVASSLKGSDVGEVKP